jgi:VWFA-related protein
MGFKLFACCTVACLLAPAVCKDELSGQQPRATIRAEVSLVNVVFTALDKNGRQVHDLKAQDFQVFEDKQPQKIEYFGELDESNNVPLTVALLIDTSGSVKEKLENEKITAAEFFKKVLRPNRDLALIIQFDSEVNLIQDFTQNQNDLLNALNHLDAGNSTALYDAVYLAAEEKLKSETGRKVIVVITDGEDTSSKIHKEDAIEAAQKSDVLIYGIGVRSERFGSNFGVLKRFADQTGGAFFSPHATLAEIQAAFRSIGEDIQGQYSLAYISSNRKKDGTYRAIDVRCKAGNVRIRARKGYYAPKEAPAP